MKTKIATIVWFLIIYCIIGNNSFAQQSDSKLNTIFDEIFIAFLGDADGNGGLLYPVPVIINDSVVSTHDKHFKGSSLRATGELTPALNNLIIGNISSFPLNSTSVGINVNFLEGKPVTEMESLGPIFAEAGKTLGKKKMNLGLNWTYLDFSSIRGLKTDEMKFSFEHADVGPEGLGNVSAESDVLDVFPDLNINASITALFATYGLTEKLDIGLAVPLIDIRMSGVARAHVNSFTFPEDGEPDHHFREGNQIIFNATKEFERSRQGIGDITVRVKYNIIKSDNFFVGVLLDGRLPTGDRENFMGTGQFSGRGSLIFSGKIKDFNPHLNVSYDYRPTSFDSDELEFAVGFDQKLISGLSLAIDLLGEINTNKNEYLTLFPGTFTIVDQRKDSNGNIVKIPREVDRSNIPEVNHDHVFNTSIGFRFTPARHVIIMTNALLPLNSGGLRSRITPAVGLALSF